MQREITMVRRRERRDAHRVPRVPGWLLALGILAAGGLLAWLHVIVLLGG